MTDSHLAQLRFDIMEKVQIHPQQAGIKTLLELDLFPDVNIEDQGTHLRIHGFLRLTGAYEGDEGASLQEESAGGGEMEETDNSELGDNQAEEIAYVIPVEITLPVDRADQERITAEIEAFDYKVLSPFELQIEAVLVIDGLLPEFEVENETEKRVEEDPMVDEQPTFSGFQGAERIVSEEEQKDEKDLQESEFLRQVDEETTDYQFIHIASQQEEKPPIPEDEMDPKELQVTDEEEDPKDTDPSLREPDVDEFQSDQESSASDLEEATHSPEQEVEETRISPEKQDIPVVINPRQHDDTWDDHDLAKKFLRPLAPLEPVKEVQQDDVPLERESIHLEEESTEDTASSEEETVTAEELREEESSASENGKETSGLDWARWLVSGEKEDSFVRLRMVIVQRDESLAGIADRYQVSPGELRHLNKLESEVLEEGQVVYIPRQSG